MPSSSEAVVIDGAVISDVLDFTFSVNFRESFPAAFAATTVNDVSPDLDGVVPEIVADSASNVSHDGSPIAVHVIGVAPVASS